MNNCSVCESVLFKDLIDTLMSTTFIQKLWILQYYKCNNHYGHGKPGQVMEFSYDYFQAWKSPWKKFNYKSFGKVMEMCCIHMFIYAEFEKINMFLKERSLNSKQAMIIIFCVESEKFIGHSNSSWGIIHCHVYNRDFTTFLVMEILFKFMDKSWKSIGQNVYEPWIIQRGIATLHDKKRAPFNPHAEVTCIDAVGDKNTCM